MPSKKTIELHVKREEDGTLYFTTEELPSFSVRMRPNEDLTTLTRLIIEHIRNRWQITYTSTSPLKPNPRDIKDQGTVAITLR